MKLASIICESMIWHDLPYYDIPGLKLCHFDPSPSRLSAHSLWHMQSPLPRPDKTFTGNWFDSNKTLISLKYKTRLISNFWPKYYNPISIDPEAAQAGKVGIEPNNHQWATLMNYLAGPMPHDWLIYWPTVGHAMYRLPNENTGIPEHIRETTRYWLDMVQVEILPKINCPVILLTDHGSVRTVHSDTFENGFAFVSNSIDCKDYLGWADIREIQERVLCI